MPGKRLVTFNQNQGSRPRRRGGRGPSHRGHGGHGRGGSSVQRDIEVPRFAVPGYLDKRIDDFKNSPPGHRFLLYFQGASYTITVTGSKKQAITDTMANNKWLDIYRKHPVGDSWESLKDAKKNALASVVDFSPQTGNLIEALRQRQNAMAAAARGKVFRFHARMTAPMAIGLGNPHPVENGFSFLNPYGIPYVPGSGIKGSLRRSAEELALFKPESGWTIPLVWVLFGFEEGSAHISPPADDLAKELQDLHKHWRSAFADYARTKAAEDELLKKWLGLESIQDSLPERLRHLASDPVKFCRALQEGDDNGKELRRSIHWQGSLVFWDVFPKIDRMAVDILNPHHKAYFEGNCGPIETEAPKPVFFLTVPPGAECAITCEMCRRSEDLPLPTDAELKKFLKAALENTLEWTGFGAKTAVGYGTGDFDGGAAEREAQKQAEEEAARARKAEEERKREETLRKAEEEARHKAEELARREAELAALPVDLAWLVRRAQDNNWEHDNGALLTDAEAFFEKHDEPGTEALKELSQWMEKKWPKIMTNPDATKGKKRRPKYKDRPRNIAKKILASWQS